MCALRLMSDAAVERADRDLLDFNRYVDPIVDILTDEDSQTPFTIGLFGGWGTGKSTVLRLVDVRLGLTVPERFVRVQFNPWLHRGEPNMLIPLLHALHDTLDTDPKKRFVASARKLTDVLIRLGADVLLKNLTADAVTLEKLEQLEKKYQEQKGRVESEIRHLRQVLQTELDSIEKKKARVVFFVDDLDRCEPTQIVDVLESLKLFFDLHNAFVILAVDKEIIDRGIEVKYGKFRFGSRKAAIGAEYIEKMVQLPFQLFPIFPEQIAGFIRSLDPPAAVAEHIPLLASVMAPNPRRIKRILNILCVITRMATSDNSLAALRTDVLLRLAILQIQSSAIYWAVAAHPDLLLALEAVYEGEKSLLRDDDWVQYGPARDAVRQFCRDNHQPETYLSTLFKGAPFGGTGQDLRRYVAMIGS